MFTSSYKGKGPLVPSLRLFFWALLLGLLLPPWSLSAQGQTEDDEDDTHDVRMALKGAMMQAHSGRPATLLRMMSSEEQARFHEDDLLGQFRRHLRALGVWINVVCANQRRDDPRLDEYRCELQCRLGTYHTWVAMSRRTPFVVAEPKAGKIERFHIVSSLSQNSDSPWLPLRGETACGVLALFCFGLLLWGGRRMKHGRRRMSRRETVPNRGLSRALREGTLVLHVLSALSMVILAYLWYRLAPLPKWGKGLVILSVLELVLLGVGLLVLGLSRYLSVRSSDLTLDGVLAAVFLPSLVLILFFGVASMASTLHLGAVEEIPSLPLQKQGETLFVRRAGPVVDLVYLYPDGRSCKGSKLESCKSYGKVVIAPTSGVVAKVARLRPDQPLSQRDRDNREGNYVLLQVGGGYLLLSNLKAGSISVVPGQKVAFGDRLGEIGNSGDSDEPHLQMELWSKWQPLPGNRPRRAWTQPTYPLFPGQIVLY